MLIGFLIWTYTLLLPTLLPADHNLIREGLFGLVWLRPEQLFYLELSPLGNGVFCSLSLNTLGLITGSLSRSSNALEMIQSTVFVQQGNRPLAGYNLANSNITVGDLIETVAQYLGDERTTRSFEAYKSRKGIELSPSDHCDVNLLQFSEQLLASAVGASSSRLVHRLLIKRFGQSSRSEMKLLDDASQALQFNRGVLQTALDQIEQGICVFDADYRLSSWNRQFREMLNLPTSIGTAGTSFSAIIREIVERNELDKYGFDEVEITQNLIDLQQTWQFELPVAGQFIDVRSTSMPQGGLVLTWQDNTDRVLSAKALRDANVLLERRVEERTGELTALNKRLEKATKIADRANQDKTRFLAAASHDILQPLNAARLYSSTLIERLEDQRNQEFALSINQSLDSVDDILGAVLAISRLDAAQDEVKLRTTSLDRIFEQLKIEFNPIAAKEKLDLIFVATSAFVRSDASLLKRLLQNLISNAIKYTNEGKVLVGCRRSGNTICIEILDTGIGIARQDQKSIFKEFKRLREGINTAPGLGLGLSIVERISGILGHQVEFESEPGSGTRFRIVVDRSETVSVEPVQPREGKTFANNIVPHMKVLCVDNDSPVLKGLSSLLQQWDCQVMTAESSFEAIELIKNQQSLPEIILMDYHLNEETGIEAILRLRKVFDNELPAVLLTAERSRALKQKAKGLGLTFINKPVKPAALRSVLASVRRVSLAAE